MLTRKSRVRHSGKVGVLVRQHEEPSRAWLDFGRRQDRRAAERQPLFEFSRFDPGGRYPRVQGHRSLFGVCDGSRWQAARRAVSRKLRIFVRMARSFGAILYLTGPKTS